MFLLRKICWQDLWLNDKHRPIIDHADNQSDDERTHGQSLRKHFSSFMKRFYDRYVIWIEPFSYCLTPTFYNSGFQNLSIERTWWIVQNESNVPVITISEKKRSTHHWLVGTLQISFPLLISSICLSACLSTVLTSWQISTVKAFNKLP